MKAVALAIDLWRRLEVPAKTKVLALSGARDFWSVVTVHGSPGFLAEPGTPPKVAAALGNEVGPKMVEITTHALLDEGPDFTFLETLSDTVGQRLQN